MKYECVTETPKFVALNLNPREHCLLIGKRVRPYPEPFFETIGQLACTSDKDLSERYSFDSETIRVIKERLSDLGLTTGMWTEDALKAISAIPSAKLEPIYPATTILGIPDLNNKIKWHDKWQRLIDFITDNGKYRPSVSLGSVALFKVEIMLQANGLHLEMTDNEAVGAINRIRSSGSREDPWSGFERAKAIHPDLLIKPETQALKERRIKRQRIIKTMRKIDTIRDDLESLDMPENQQLVDHLSQNLKDDPSLLERDLRTFDGSVRKTNSTYSQN